MFLSTGYSVENTGHQYLTTVIIIIILNKYTKLNEPIWTRDASDIKIEKPTLIHKII